MGFYVMSIQTHKYDFLDFVDRKYTCKLESLPFGFNGRNNFCAFPRDEVPTYLNSEKNHHK